jgi:methionine-rich copper-binding protein CopC
MQFLRRLASLSTLVVGALLLALAFAPNGAWAHAHLESSSPAEGATVPAGLTSITLTFSEEISVEQSAADLSGPSGAVAGASAAVNRADRKMLTVTTPGLTEGKYTLAWKAVTEDDNGITNGTLTFSVGGGTENTGTGQGSTTPSTGGSSLPTTGAGGSELASLAAMGAALALMVAGVALRRRSRV